MSASQRDVRHVPIVAVFGSGGSVATAEALGCELGRRGCIVLTGGNGPSGEAVKNKALAGADRAAKEGHIAPWIGVPQARDGGAQPGMDRLRSYVLDTRLGDERNYLEAELCDSAIAIAGGDGTATEAAFCLALGRPVVLLGQWFETLETSSHSARIAKLVEAIDTRILAKKSIDPEVRQPIEHAKTTLAGMMVPPVHRSATPLLELVDEAERAGRAAPDRDLPNLAVLAPHRAPYLTWLATVRANLARRSI